LRILALITARGGSKRVPGKNIRLLGSRPLIGWSVAVAKGLADICDILVSTDNAEIASVARTEGALVPWLRPAELASDTASSVDVSLHALEWYERQNGKIDGLLLLQPTSPFRTRDTVFRGIELFRLSNRRSVVGVSPAASHPMWCYQLDEDTLRPFVDRGNLYLRSQDLPPAYVVNGAFYLISPEKLRQMHGFINDDTMPLVMDGRREGMDIDTEWDWKIAEMAYSLSDMEGK
jgi:CMP-N,N'-diacetyllegionaminic acid synthase